MIRLTVMYNLPDGASEGEFLKWRLSEHQDSNAAMSGVVRTDFAEIVECWPKDSIPLYRFQTTADWPDRDSFEKGFYGEGAQSALHENLKKLGEYSFTVSHVLIESRNES